MIRRWPATSASLIVLVVMTAMFLASGALVPRELPSYASSSRQIIGMALMLILLPAYVAGALVVMPRRSVALVEQLRGVLPTAAHADEAVQKIRSGLRSSWRWAVIVGIAMGLANTQPLRAMFESESPVLETSLSFGQLALWLLVGLNLGARVQAARAFGRLGEVVEFDLFRLEKLRPLARSGMIDVVVIVLGLAITPLQSLDAEFRWYNYRFGLGVLGPAALMLLLLPLRSVHRRIRDEKERQLARVDALIAHASDASSPQEVVALESLLAHRDRLRSQRTWPLGTALLSRLLFYLVIPPLAWAGAAIVEMFVDRMISG